MKRTDPLSLPRVTWLFLVALGAPIVGPPSAARAMVDTGQTACFGASTSIACPQPGQPFHGQDAQYDGDQPGFTLSGDGLTVLDDVTGLTWQQSPDTDGDSVVETADKMSWSDAMARPAILNAQSWGGFDDWRLPTIKELYSLIDFSGLDPSGYEGDTSGLVPFIDTDYFGFAYGDESADERIIDSQYWSETEYVSTTMGGDHTVFGVNFADGRIKGYGTTLHGTDKTSFVQCVRGNITYGDNVFVDNGDGTVTDESTGMMWMKSDTGAGMDWEAALAYAEGLSFAGHDDWRLPNVKELQGIVDYTRSPDTHGTAAIDPIFNCTAIIDEGGGTNFPFYWSGTTHENWTASSGGWGAYICFGDALGWMQSPFPPFDYTLMDVHGAGAQRGDPKSGNAANWPYGNGPQGDVVRIDNFVRCVRDVSLATDVGEALRDGDTDLQLKASPNPFVSTTELVFSVPESGRVTVVVYDILGRRIRKLVAGELVAGEHRVRWDGADSEDRPMPSGIYFAQIETPAGHGNLKVLLAR